MRIRTTKWIFLCLSLLPAACVTAPPTTPAAGTDGDHVVTITNATATAIDALRLSPSSQDKWGDDRLGDDTIGPGSSFVLHLPGAECHYDLRARYHSGRSEEVYKVDICANPRVAFDGSRMVMSGVIGDGETAHFEHTTVIANASRQEIQSIYVSPPGSDRWGYDLVHASTLPAGRRITIGFDGGCSQDIKIDYAGGGGDEARGIDLCQARLDIRPGWTSRR